MLKRFDSSFQGFQHLKDVEILGVISNYLKDHQGFGDLVYKDETSAIYLSQKLHLKLSLDLHNFQLTPIDLNHPKKDLLDLQRNHLEESINDPMAVMRELIDWFNNDDDQEVDGFDDENDIEEEIKPLPTIAHNKESLSSMFGVGKKENFYIIKSIIISMRRFYMVRKQVLIGILMVDFMM
jgi:hypothetical protein